jgi:hypothetical protein
VASRPDVRQARVSDAVALRRRLIAAGAAVLAYWVASPIVIAALSRIGIKGGLADILVIGLGIVGTLSLVPLVTAYAGQGGVAQAQQQPRRLIAGLMGVVLIILVGLPMASYARGWGSTPAPVSPPATQAPTSTATPHPASSQSSGETNPPANETLPPGATEPPAQSVTTSDKAANLFGGASDRWSNIGQIWILEKGKSAHLTVPPGWAISYTDNVGGSHGCTTDGDWLQGPQTVVAVSAVLVPSAMANCT